MSRMSLTYDPEEAIAHLTTVDPLMGALIARVGDFTLRPELTNSSWAATENWAHVANFARLEPCVVVNF